MHTIIITSIEIAILVRMRLISDMYKYYYIYLYNRITITSH